jgi:(2Fe-2S) ferredoxin
VSDWAPCSDRARERDDPLAGTASRGDTWFLVENPAGWGRHAFLDPPFDVGLGRELVRRVEGAGVRPLAIRRVDRRRVPIGLRWAWVDSRPGRESVVWGEVSHPRQLLDVPLDGSAGTSSDELVFAVCTHGRHDQCCAVRGRPVALRLSERYPEQTWECSHLGGDRFAGTMVVLPHGLYYGRVDDADALDVADAYLDGRVVPGLLRGRSSLSHPVQSAQDAARRLLGDHRVDAFPPVLEERRGDGWYVELATTEGVVAVTLAQVASERLLSTCTATRAVSVPALVAVDVQVRQPGPA